MNELTYIAFCGAAALFIIGFAVVLAVVVVMAHDLARIMKRRNDG